MKVGVYLGDSVPQLGGGFTFEEEVCQSLVRHASETQHKFVLVTSAPSEQVSQLPGSMDVISVRRSLSRRISKRLSAEGQKVANRIRSSGTRRPVVMDAERSLAESGVELVWSLNFNTPVLEIPFITTVWDLQHRLQPIFPEVSTQGHWEARERHFGRTLRRATAVIAGTEAGKREITSFYQVPPERIWILPHPTPGFALERSAGDINKVLQKHALPSEYLFYPAQFWPHKNHVAILRALQILRDEHGLRMPVVFVGSDRGNLEHVRTLVQRCSLSEQVRFLGFVPRDELVALYRAAFALVYPTYFGPENLPPLEAFALGCPVVASAVSGSEEQLGDAALLVDPADHRQLAVAIKRLHDDSELRLALVERGRERARRFTGTDFVRGAFALLEKLEPIRMTWTSGIYRHQ